MGDWHVEPKGAKAADEHRFHGLGVGASWRGEQFDAHGFIVRSPGSHQKGRSSPPAVWSASSWFETWNPTDGTCGSVPYGTRGLVSALAMGAKANPAPIAAAANAGAMYLIVVFMMFS
jgi:hypothetical protein